MSRYYVVGVKDSFEKGVLDAPIGAEIQVRDEEGNEFYVSVLESAGVPSFYKTENSVLNSLMDPGDDEALIDELNSKALSYDGYEDLFKHKDDDLFPVLRLLTYIARAPQEEFDKYKDVQIGKYIDEIDVPKADVEK